MRKKKIEYKDYKARNTVSNILDIITKNIINNFDPDLIILFGLYSYENMINTPIREASGDIDILIVKDDEELAKLDVADRSLYLNKYISGINKIININIWMFTPEEIKQRKKSKDLFINYIFEKHKVLYKKEEVVSEAAWLNYINFINQIYSQIGIKAYFGKEET